MNHNNDLVRDLRALADFLEATEFPEKTRIFGPLISVYVMADDARTFGEATKALGACEKSSTEHYINAEKKFGEVLLQVSAGRFIVCTRKKVGERHIEAKPERLLPAEPECVEDIIEWDCPPSYLRLARKG